MTRCQQSDGDSKLGRLVFRSVGIQLRLWDGYISADAREARLSLHAMFGKRSTICVDADCDALEAGHRERYFGRALERGRGEGRRGPV